ncbi:hypothetical protein CRG98_009542 [Punica granatum]|uniref:Uncharacterized protein n=1 Tax=Punica granatum TaxID=22663 RepID=A0A2I0KNR6_PUNGR|nr:hypothetical protein CRG98_009542 [Punica granatum]
MNRLITPQNLGAKDLASLSRNSVIPSLKMGGKAPGSRMTLLDESGHLTGRKDPNEKSKPWENLACTGETGDFSHSAQGLWTLKRLLNTAPGGLLEVVHGLGRARLTRLTEKNRDTREEPERVEEWEGVRVSCAIPVTEKGKE